MGTKREKKVGGKKGKQKNGGKKRKKKVGKKKKVASGLTAKRTFQYVNEIGLELSNEADEGHDCPRVSHAQLVVDGVGEVR